VSSEQLEAVRLKFTSGNRVPVDRASITRAEWDAIEALLAARSQSSVPVSTSAEDFACWLINHCEKSVVYEEDAQRWLADFLIAESGCVRPLQHSVPVEAFEALKKFYTPHGVCVRIHDVRQLIAEHGGKGDV
jgi:hypothetical protein